MIYTPTYGGVAEAILKMSMGNEIGFEFDSGVSMADIFGYNYGSFIIELSGDAEIGKVIGKTTTKAEISYKGDVLTFAEIFGIYEDKLEEIYPVGAKESGKAENVSFDEKKVCAPAIKVAKPKVLIPVFPGTNCEYDTKKAFADAGADAEIFVINNMTAKGIANSVEVFSKKIKDSQIIFIPGGFSGGDEPDGSGKFITACFRNAEVKDAVTELLEKRDGLMGGICNGFQALVKLGLVPFGKIIDADENTPTLTFNTISRHQSKIVRTRVASNNSPWLSETSVGDIYYVPISHGEGRFIANDEVLSELVKNGQIMTQYVDFDGNATMDINHNPNGSYNAIEGILSPDGRVFGKMGHSERIGAGLYKNVPGDYDMGLFRSAVEYFTK